MPRPHSASRGARTDRPQRTPIARPPRISHRDLALPSIATAPFDDDGWIFELKYDGFRALVLKAGPTTKIVSRQGVALERAFPEIVEELATLPDCALDGELTIVDARGMSDFDALAARSRAATPRAIAAAARSKPAAFLAFDLLALADEDCRGLRLLERKARLEKLLHRLARIKAVQYVEAEGKALYRAVVGMGLEGIVAKRIDARYPRGRTRDWLKIKTEAGVRTTERRGDAWYGGPGEATRAKRAARDAGRSAPSTRLADASAARKDQLRRLGRQLREVDADELSLDLDGHPIRLTKLQTLLWPQRDQKQAWRKADYLAYLLELAPYIVPHLAQRPLTLFVYRSGIDGPRSVEMHWRVNPPPFVATVPIYSSNEKRDHRYVLCNDAASLLWLGHAGALELHPWHSRLDPHPDAEGRSTDASGSLRQLQSSILDYPDHIFFDIDSFVYSGKERAGAPPEYHAQGFARCRAAALRLRDVLAELSLESFVKTSGRTGLHVLAPIVRSIDFAAAREICRRICARLLDEAPAHFTMDPRVQQRAGKVFLDFGMNRRASSMVAAYTPRAVAGGIVSMPLAWDELAHAEPPDFRMDNALARVEARGDPWRDLLASKREPPRELAGPSGRTRG